MTGPLTADVEPLWTAEQVARHLSVSIDTVRRLSTALGARRIAPNVVRFRPADVLAYEDRQRVPATPEPVAESEAPRRQPRSAALLHLGPVNRVTGRRRGAS
jgi:hypothetical protein